MARKKGLLNKTLNKIYRWLPGHLKHRLVRRGLRVTRYLPQELSFKVADTKDELEAAYRILHDAYVDCGYTEKTPSGMRLVKHFALPTTTTLVAKWKDQVVGTVSVIRHTPLGLPIQSIFSLDEVLAPGKAIAEVSALAIDKNFRQRQGTIFLPLCRFFYEYSTQYMGIDRVVIAVNPTWSDFYEGLLCFRRLENKVVAKYNFANGAPAIGLWADLQELKDFLEKHYDHLPDRSNLFSYFTKGEIKSFQFPEREYVRAFDPVITPFLMKYFFSEKSNLFSELSHEDKQMIANYYPHEEYQQLLCGQVIKRNGDFRFVVSARANLYDITSMTEPDIDCRILDVSKRGIKVQGTPPPGKRVNLEIHVSRDKTVLISGKVRWIEREANIFGVEVDQQSSEWADYLEYLHKVYHDLSAKAAA